MSAHESAIGPLAGALVDAQDQLLALYELATLSTTSLDESECTEPILGRAMRLLGADSLFFERDAGVVSIAPASAYEVSLPVENSVGLRGTLHAERRSMPFGTADMKLLRAVAHMALAAVHTSQLHAEAVTQAVVASDHDTASLLAQRSLPSWRPVAENLGFFARSDPAKTAGGDLFTFAESNGWLNVVVGDVSGKGLPAAMVMTTVISASNAALSANAGDPAATLRAVDGWVYESLSESGLFVTMFACSVNETTGEIRMANAGHSPVLLVADGAVTPVSASAPPIGVLPLCDTELATTTVVFTSGGRLAICSDGLSEQVNTDTEMFGEIRLNDMLAQTETSATDLGPRLFAEVDVFADGAAQSDDRTLVIIDVHPVNVELNAPEGEQR